MEKQTSFVATPQTTAYWHIFVDGAARNNPGPAGAGIYITCHHEVIYKEGFYLGEKTNNQAEYLSLLLALFIAQQEALNRNIPLPPLLIKSDSELLVRQIKGHYQVKNIQLAKIKKIIDTILHHKTYSIEHTPREGNKMADKLANKGVDSKKKLPQDFLTLLSKHGIAI